MRLGVGALGGLISIWNEDSLRKEDVFLLKGYWQLNLVLRVITSGGQLLMSMVHMRIQREVIFVRIFLIFIHFGQFHGVLVGIFI